MVKSSVILCAIILTISLHRTFSVSVHKPGSSLNVSNTNYETAARKPVTQDGDETSQEEADDENDNDEEGAETNEYEEDRNCTCSGSHCMCCINLNLSFIDLGGPGCVKFDYIPLNDSMAVNMSYGERLLESSLIKRDSPEPACMDLFSDLAQMCAKFSGLSRVAKGVKGCVSVEPLLLGVSQTVYDVGCFNMDIEGAQPPLTHGIAQATHHKSNSTKETTEKPEENEEEEELAAAISQSAEEGIAWFNNFITSVFGEELNDTSSDTSSETPSRNRPLNQTKLTS